MPQPQQMRQPEQALAESNRQITRIPRLSSILGRYLLGKEDRVNFIYYQFNFEIATALFKLQEKLTKQNAVFYMGFMFNLLRIIEFSANPVRDREYLKAFFKALVGAIPNASYSVFFLVVNYFFQPGSGPNELLGAKSKLSQYFIQFLE